MNNHFLPNIPIVYYFYCPTCSDMKDFLIDELEDYARGHLAYCCNECDGIYPMPTEMVPRDEREAYKVTVQILDDMLHFRDDEKIELMQAVRKMKAVEVMANSVIYSNIKAFKEVKTYIKKKEYKNASKECENMIKFLKRNSEKAKNNELVRELVDGKTENT